MKKFLLCIALMLLSLAAMAQVEPTSMSDIQKFIESLGGLKGLGALGIAAIAVQGLLLFFKSAFASFAGPAKILIVYGLTLVAGVLSLKISGVDWGGALLHTQTLAAAQVFLHQLYKQLTGK